MLQKLLDSMNKSLEQAIVKLAKRPLTDIFGYIVPSEALLLTEEEANNFVVFNVQKYWCGTERLNSNDWQLQWANTYLMDGPLEHSSCLPKEYRVIMDYLLLHHELTLGNFMSVFQGKELDGTGLQKIFLYKIDNRYLVHPIFEEHNAYWHWIFIQKIYSIFIHIPLEKIDYIPELFQQVELSAKIAFQHKKGFSDEFIAATNSWIRQIDKQNEDNAAKKVLLIQRVICYFKLSRGQDQRLEQLVHELKTRWLKGKTALTDKEIIMLTYIQFVLASYQGNTDKLLKYGRFLLEQDRLNNYAVEIMVEYKDVLPSVKPTPHIFVKAYNVNYLEYILYTLIGAFVEQKHYQAAYGILKEYELASCEFIYLYINEECTEQDMYRMEATVQRDIAFIVDQSPQHVSASIERWRAVYNQEESEYYQVAEMTSKHLCHIMKVLFAVEQYDLFERLMEIYKKYLLIDAHFEDMRQFIEQYVK